MTAIDFLNRYDPQDLLTEIDRERCERDLVEFYKGAWSQFDPSQYQHNWHVDCIGDHLMSVADGQIRKLLINCPFRIGKSNLVSIAFPAWIWAQSGVGALTGPQVQFLCVSYASKLSLEIATKARRLIDSRWFQDRWGDRVIISSDQDSKENFSTTAGGGRISVGLEGSTMGRGGAIKLIDDPHKVDDINSEVIMEGAIRTYDEALASRFTDPRSSAEIIIMQRLGENDLSGHVLEKYSDFVHLNLPMSYDPLRHCVTSIGWQDPRGCDENGDKLSGIGSDRNGAAMVIPGSPMAKAEGKLLWPERFTPDVMSALMENLGEYGVAGQLQQAPVPRGGGVIRSEWWGFWPGDVFPDFRFVLVSVDTASTEKETNDESGVTAWGVFEGDKGQPNVMLIDAWEGKVEFSSLVEKVASIARKHKADAVLIEGKANGISVIQEIKRLYGQREWQTLQFDPTGDKMARLLSVQPQWSGSYYVPPGEIKGSWVGGVVFAPDKEWAQMVIDRVASFPRGKRKAIVDTTSQAIKWLRDRGWMLTREEHEIDQYEQNVFRKQSAPIYDV
jgi:predicted phage terminase large subunit-like protein